MLEPGGPTQPVSHPPLQAAAGGAKEVGGRALSAAEQAARGAAYGAAGKGQGRMQLTGGTIVCCAPADVLSELRAF